MEKRTLGNSELKVPTICLGGNVFGWTADETQSFKILDAAVDGGLNFIDTADIYSYWVSGSDGGESETIIGNWIKKRGNRDSLVIATKVGMDTGKGRKKLLARDNIKSAVEKSLKRLNSDYIDLYQSHADDPDTPLSETLEAYGDLIKQGKVRAIGASNYSVARLTEAVSISKKLGLPSYQALQPEYNLYDREIFEKELEPFCLKHQIGVINYYALASGFLTGKYRSKDDLGKKARSGAVGKYLNGRGTRILDALAKVANEYQSTSASVALAWQIARPGITSPIASATSTDQVKDLVAATQLKLSPDAISTLTKASE